MKLKFPNLFVLIALVVSLVSFQPAYAAGTIFVNTATDDNIDNALCSLREAIVAANTDAIYQGCPAGSGADTIQFNGNYTITLTNQLPSVTSNIIITGNGAANTIIQANVNPGVATYRVMWVSSTGTLYLQGVTVKNGNCTGACAGGGGIYNAGDITIVNSVLSANSTSTDGGAIFNSLNSTLGMADSQVNSNSAEGNGGAIAGSTNSQIEIRRSVLSGNSAANGGGIYLDGATYLYLADSTLHGNTAQTHGGGIMQSGGTTSQSTFERNLFSSNQANTGYGGAIYNAGKLNIRNNTFYNNEALFYGGGVFNVTAGTEYLSILQNTFSANYADTGGGLYNATGSDIVLFNNNILSDGNLMADCYNNGGTIANTGTNLIETNGSGANACAGSVISADPKLGPLMDHGGYTQTMALLAASPAIDAAPSCYAPPTDQRGINRPQSTECDFGAYEKNLTFADVPFDHWAWQYIESISFAGITGGCSASPLNYCPSVTVTRDQMAVFLLRGIHGSAYTPPAATGAVFADVPADYWAAAWIEQLAAEGITGGCGNGNYCPSTPVSRDQMAIFLLRSEHGSSYTPPTATGAVFGDIPANFWAAAWVEQLASEGITGGCGGGNYCPSTPVSRDQMAVFLQRTFNLVLP